MRSFIKVVASLLAVLLFLVGLEQMSYRFSSWYASVRADWIWSQFDEKGPFSQVLGILSFEQLASAPPNTLSGEASVREESFYAEHILSHTRPMRDELFERFRSGKVLSESDYEIRNVGGVAELVLPKLTSKAAEEDVEKGWAKKKDEEMADAHALLLRVLPGRDRMSEAELSAIRKRAESQFAPMLERGVACGFVHAADSEKLVKAVEELRRREGRLSRSLLAWGRQKSAGVLAEAVNSRPELWSAVVYDSPGERSLPEPGPGVVGGPWVMSLLELSVKTFEKESAQKMVNWARAGRSSAGAGPFRNRFGGLFHFVTFPAEAPAKNGVSRAVILSDESAVMGYAFLLERVKRPTKYESEKAPSSISWNAGFDSTPLPQQVREDRDAGNETIDQRIVSHGAGSPIPEPRVGESYDCQVLRFYRDRHPEWVDRADSAIILEVGGMLESQDKLQIIGKKDPEFLLYYRNLKALNSTP